MDTKTISAIIVVLIVVIALGAYVAMKSGGGATTTTAKAEKVVVIGVTDKVTDLDPSNAYDFFTWEVLYNTMEGLVKYKPGTLEIVPGLAENWTVSNDGLAWTFKLRKNLKFADGTPLTAKDVVRSINRVMTIKGDPSWLVTSFVKSVEAPDEQTVVFHLKKPISYFLYLLVTPPYFPVNPKYPNNQIVSNATWGEAGQYMIKSFVRDQELVLVPNPYYYGEKPKNDKIIIRFYKDASTMRLALQNGEIDIAWRTLQPTDIQFFRNQTGFKVVDVPGAFIRYIVLNVKMNPTSKVLVRKALATVINRTDIIQSALFGAGEPLYSMIPTSMSAYKPVFKTMYGDGNLQLAKKLLKQAGYSESNPLQITLWYTPTHYGDTESSIATVLKEQWEATGMIKVTIRSAEWGEYVDKARHGELMVYLLGWYPDYLDPDDYTTPFLHTGDNSWLGNGYSNPQMDKLLEKAQVVLDQNERNQLYSQVQDILGQDVPLIPMFEGKLYIVANNAVQGIVPSPTMIFFYSTLEK